MFYKQKRELEERELALDIREMGLDLRAEKESGKQRVEIKKVELEFEGSKIKLEQFAYNETVKLLNQKNELLNEFYVKLLDGKDGEIKSLRETILTLIEKFPKDKETQITQNIK